MSASWSRKFASGSVAAVLIFSCTSVSAADAADSYPSRSIRLLTANSPGGSADQLLRSISEVLSKELGRSAVVENKPGAEGLLAGEACARAQADGHTLCMLDLFNWALLPRMRADLPYRPSDLEPVMLLAYIPAGFWSHPRLAVDNMKELIARARSRPEEVTLGSWGKMSTPYLYGEFFRHTAGATFNVISYKSVTQAWQAVVAGEVQSTTYSILAGLPYMKSGKVKLLAINTAQRLPSLPDIPTFAEEGMPSVTQWLALFAPPGTPSAIVEKINAALARGAYADPAVAGRIFAQFSVSDVAGGPSAGFRAFLSDQQSQFDKLLEAARIKPE
ncbi:Tripartite tricarboxylate transporter family receptor [Pigmentiphaga humi]|uniref:Tripartite tricarboxylate transporter family receptor n=1 Tax=Pigmentiphaga humi TaxID=2478468 RepID=A0A3P4AXG0_9BURK|nr:tripartite tricarboxylate transporter substrate binding protein [Pigmentiphaga humi]VCU68221.1 Tripartite tricarboxylate transporter family receptor [Pigmentiphaga humi]